MIGKMGYIQSIVPLGARTATNAVAPAGGCTDPVTSMSNKDNETASAHFAGFTSGLVPRVAFRQSIPTKAASVFPVIALCGCANGACGTPNKRMDCAPKLVTNGTLLFSASWTMINVKMPKKAQKVAQHK